MRSGVAAGPVGEVLPVTKSAAPSTCRECRAVSAFQSGQSVPEKSVSWDSTLAAVKTPPNSGRNFKDPKTGACRSHEDPRSL